MLGQQEAPIIVGSRWRSVTVIGKKLLTREIEVIGAPTLSSPVNYVIRRNDAHPHRIGKKASIRRATLRRNFRQVS